VSLSESDPTVVGLSHMHDRMDVGTARLVKERKAYEGWCPRTFTVNNDSECEGRPLIHIPMQNGEISVIVVRAVA
jgi:hypothetical protein